MNARNHVVSMGVEFAESCGMKLSPRYRQILAENALQEERVMAESLGRLPMLVNTDDSAAVARLADAISDDPARFAVRFMNLERIVQQLAARVDGLAYRENV